MFFQQLTALCHASILLRVGVSFSFIYPALSALFNPYAWIGYFPEFVSTAVGSYAMTLLHTFGLVEVIIGVWILFGKNIFIPSATAAALLFLIIIFNLNQMDVLFRDIPILLMALILALESRFKMSELV